VVKLRVKRAFFDREAKIYRPSGQIFEVSDVRAAVLLAAGVAEVVEVLEASTEEATVEKPEPPPKNKRKKG